MSGNCGYTAKDDTYGPLPLVLTVPEAAKKLRIGIGRCYELVRCGQLRSIKVGKRFLVPRGAIFEFLGMTEEVSV